MWIKLLFALVVSLTAVAGVTLFALESGSVVTVKTSIPEGAPGSDVGGERTTRIWFVQENGQLFLEAGHPDNPWVGDLRGMSSLQLVGQGLDGEYTFEVLDDSADHDRIRQLMRRKYGWRDWWIGLIFDTSRSQLVVIRPL